MPVLEILKSFTFRALPTTWLHRLRKLHYARKLARASEEPEMRVIRPLLPAGSTALDLGANFGLYARYLAEMVGPTGQVFSVEPIPSTFEILSSNLHKHRLHQVTPLNLALSDKTGMVRMFVPNYSSGGANFYEARIVSDERQNAIEIPCATLDQTFGNLKQIHFIKCDVEGHEWSVIQGATRILKDHTPAWMIELSENPDKPGSSAESLVRLLRKHGYAEYILKGSTLRRRVEKEQATNFFFLRPEHVAKLPASLIS